MYFQILVSLVVALGLITTCHTNSCSVSAPEITLRELNSGCYLNGRSRYPECVSAMHDFCDLVVYPTSLNYIIGISRENVNLTIDMSCIKAVWYGDVPVGNLTRYDPDCVKYRSQHTPCLSAIHRYCIDRLGSNMAAGISQKMYVGIEFLSIGCFIATHTDNVSISIMTSLNFGCIWPNADTDACFAAASSYCSQYFGYSGGITQELTKEIMTVACYDAEFSGVAYMIRNTNFYEAINEVDKVCSLDFALAEGKILQTTPDILVEQSFDNRKSKVKMSDVFKVSKSIIMPHSFLHTHKFRIDANTTFKTGVPFLTSGEMKLSAIDPGGFNLTKENLKTITYETTSNVKVPPGKAIIKSAIIIRADLNVPWTAKIVNKLGSIHTISGMWSGVNIDKLQIVQKDIV